MNLSKTLRESVNKWKDKIALMDERKELTYEQLQRNVNSISTALLNFGIKKGDVGVIFLPDSVEFALIYYSLLNIGAIGAPIDIRLKEEELRTIFKDAIPRIIFTTSEHQEMMFAIKKDIPSIKNIIVLGKEVEEDAIDFQDVLKTPSRDIPIADVSDEDVALYLYTSGTTGKPKGVMTTYGNLDCFPKSIKERWKLNESDRYLLCLPASHISGPICFNLPITIGTGCVILGSFHPKKWLEFVEKFKVTSTHLVPPIASALLQYNQFDKYDISSLKGVALMGAYSSYGLVKAFGMALGFGRGCWQGYGLTETSPLITLEPIGGEERAGSTIGPAVEGIEVRIVEPDTQKDVHLGEVGEIITRGPHIMKGYHNNPEATKERIKNGWLYTGDLARMDKDGYMYIVGRKQDRINVGGLMVYVSEVEDVLFHHPKIKEAAVTSITDEKRGEKVKAVIVLKDGETASESDIINYCKERIASYKVPKVVEFRISLPKTSTGKIDKKALKS